LDGKQFSSQYGLVTKNWLSMWTARLARAWAWIADAATRPTHYQESWDRWDVDAGRRRELNDLEAIWVRFPDHR